jgi:hypothetical protein
MKKVIFVLLMVAGMAATAQTFEDRLIMACDAVKLKTVQADNGVTVVLAEYEYSENFMRMLISTELDLIGAVAKTPWNRDDKIEMLDVEYNGTFYLVALVKDTKYLAVSY